MKPLPLAVVILAAALASWWLFAPGDTTAPPSELGSEPAQDGPGGAAPEPPAPKPAEPTAGKVNAEAKATAELSKPATKPAAVPGLPLADKYIDRATWSDERGDVVLQHLAEAAGKRLHILDSARAKLESLHVSLEFGRMPVPKVLNLILQPHLLGWTVRGETLEIFDDDDD